MRQPFGISVAELLVALAIVGVLTGFALPVFQDFVERNRSTIALNQLLGALQSARAAAVTLRSVVVVCPGGSAVACGARDSWHLGMLIFADRDGDGRRAPDEDVLRWLPGLANGGRVYWRSFRSRSYLQFNPSGLTNWQNGNLLYCPRGGDVHFARAVIINPAGRPRKAPDRNHDGIPEDANGQPVRCP